MSATLRLEYVCTDAEMEEAQSLELCQNLGRGSKWRTRLILYGMLLVMLLEFYVRILRDKPAIWTLYGFGAMFVLTLVVLFWQRTRRCARKHATTRIEATSADLTLLGPNSKTTSPWSAFSDCLESPNLFVLVDRPKTVIIILPKRAFPDENWQNWFRERANNRPPPALQPAMDAPVATLASSPDRITLSFRMNYWDYLDRTLASWFTWGAIFAVTGLIGGTTLYSMVFPPPDALPITGGFFVALLLPLLIFPVALILMFSIFPWRAHAKHLGAEQVSLAEGSITFAGSDGTSNVDWASFTCYKETRRSFILWGPVRAFWVLFPKRALASADDVERCRALLSRHLRQSRWFIG